MDTNSLYLSYLYEVPVSFKMFLIFSHKQTTKSFSITAISEIPT